MSTTAQQDATTVAEEYVRVMADVVAQARALAARRGVAAEPRADEDLLQGLARLRAAVSAAGPRPGARIAAGRRRAARVAGAGG